MTKELENLLEKELETLTKKRHIKHAFLGILSTDCSFRWIGAKGVAQPGGTNVTPKTTYWIASITKLYIASTVLILEEGGYVNLDEGMGKYLPSELVRGLHVLNGTDFTNRITVRNLLEHSSGLPDYLEAHDKNEKGIFESVIEDGDRSFSINDFLDVIRNADYPFFPPQIKEIENKKIRYSDTNFQLLIAIIENVTGKKIYEVFNDFIFTPLGLKNTFHPKKELMGKNLRTVPIWYKDQVLNIPKAMASFNDLGSNLDDQLDFMNALIKGELFKNPKTINKMHEKWNRFSFSLSPIGPGWPIEYGLGMMRFKYPRFLAPFNTPPEIIGHTGVTGSWLFYCPSIKMILAGNVSQVIASAIPFQFVPGLIQTIKPYINN